MLLICWRDESLFMGDVPNWPGVVGGASDLLPSFLLKPPSVPILHQVRLVQVHRPAESAGPVLYVRRVSSRQTSWSCWRRGSTLPPSGWMSACRTLQLKLNQLNWCGVSSFIHLFLSSLRLEGFQFSTSHKRHQFWKTDTKKWCHLLLQMGGATL